MSDACSMKCCPNQGIHDIGGGQWLCFGCFLKLFKPRKR